MSVNLKLISAFLSVAQNESFRKAAEQTHRSPTAVSMQIKQLEEQLGVVLFQRTTRKVTLTRHGEQLMVSARKALAELDVGLLQLRQAAELEGGHLSIACVPTVASTRLPVILTAFARKYPGITVHVRELANPELFDAVSRRDVDFAIGPAVATRADLQFTPIFTDDYFALLPKGYEDAGRAGISLRDLSKMPLLRLAGSTAFGDHVDSALRADGQVVDSNFEFLHVTTLVAMAEAGLGIALLPGIAVPARTPLKVVRVTGPTLSRQIAIAQLRGDSLSPAALKLVELCRHLIAPPARRTRGVGSSP